MKISENIKTFSVNSSYFYQLSSVSEFSNISLLQRN